MSFYDKDKKYPVKTHLTWDIQDGSKLKTLMECQRKYFYEYVLGWRLDSPNIHLIFGTAWHKALAHLFLTDFSYENIKEAYHNHFLPYYREFYDPSDDEFNFPKIPIRAYLALAAYSNTEFIKNFERESKIIKYGGKPMVEIGGVINLSDDREMAFRMDTIAETPSGIISLEHKTGSSIYNWDYQWSLSMQVGIYSHVLYCMYKEKEVRGVLISGTFFKKTKDDPKKDSIDPFRHFEFRNVPVYKSPGNMNVWLNNALWWLDIIEWNFDQLSECSDEDKVLTAFPMTTTNCSNWTGCPYHDFCIAWDNPLRNCDILPIGFKIDFWNPLEEEVKTKVILNKRKGAVL